MSFVSSLNPPGNYDGNSYWFVFRNDSILVGYNGDQVGIPQFQDTIPLSIDNDKQQFLGFWDTAPCYIAEADEQSDYSEQFTFQRLRSLVGVLTKEQLQVVGRAYHLYHWDRTNRFCGGCGNPMEHSTTERAKVCPSCNLIRYPRISPAVIVAVIKNDKLLLAGNSRFRGKFYSVLAGFVEPGETLEECVTREIKEEAGIDVTDIRYFKSQPWSFPDSLMIGFTARYAGGELTVDGEELTEAGWYTADALPDIPGPYSISRELIDWFVERNGR
jgi:NAD+ diphosphatase